MTAKCAITRHFGGREGDRSLIPAFSCRSDEGVGVLGAFVVSILYNRIVRFMYVFVLSSCDRKTDFALHCLSTKDLPNNAFESTGLLPLGRVFESIAVK